MLRSGHPPRDQRSHVLVTGASSGIGKAIATSFLEQGWSVYGTSRNPTPGKLDQRVHWLAFDGSTPQGLEAFLKANGALLEQTDLLVNNAGSCRFGDNAVLPGEEAATEWHLLFTAPRELMRTVLPPMRRRGGGIIVNVTSLAAAFPLPGMSLYTAAKAALSSYTQSLQLTEDARRVRLVDLQPGDIRTGFNHAVSQDGTLREQEKRAWKKMEKLMENAPPPEQVARDLRKILGGKGHAVVRSGGFFQCRMAPLGIRFLPRSCLLRLIRRYYGIAPE